MATPILENITLPKTYEEFQDFFDTHFKLRQRLARADYHSVVSMKRQGRHQTLDGKDWSFNPVVLLCPCTQEFTDVIPIETWTADDKVTCSACGKVYTEKHLKLLDEIKTFKAAKAKQILLEKHNPAYAAENGIEFEGGALSMIDYSTEYNKIASLFNKPIDPLVVPAFAYKDLSWVNYKNTVSAIADLKETDSVISMTAMSLTLDLMQTAQAKWIYKMSVNRETLAFNKNDRRFRSSFYRSGRYITDRGGFLERTGQFKPSALADVMPVIQGRPKSGVVGLSVKNLISKIQTFATIFGQCGPLKYGYVASTSQLTKSGIMRLTPGLRLMETFMNRVHAQFDILPDAHIDNAPTMDTVDALLDAPRGYNVEAFYSAMRKKLFQVLYAGAEQNITLFADAANLDFFRLCVYLHEQYHFEVNKKLYELFTGEQFTSIRTFLKQRLNLSKRGMKAYLALARHTGERLRLYSRTGKRLRLNCVPYSFFAFAFVDTIKEPALSYAFLKDALASIDYLYATPFEYGEGFSCDVFMTIDNGMLVAPFGRKYRLAASRFYHKLLHRTLLSDMCESFTAKDIISSANTLVARLHKLPSSARRPSVTALIDFFNSQHVGSLNACEQAFIDLQESILDTNPAYEALVKADFMELNQSEDDHKTYERVEGATTFTIPSHGLDMFRLGRELSICVGGNYYQHEVANNRIQIVIAKHADKKVVFEIAKPAKDPLTKAPESGNGTVAQAKSKFNRVYDAYPEMLDDIKAYIAHLKLSVRTYDLPEEFATIND